MRIKTIVFGDDSNPVFPKLESVITEALSAVTNEDIEYPSVYGVVRSGLGEIATSLKNTDILFLFADEKLFHEAKRSVCKAFRFDMIHSEDVLTRLRRIRNSERFMMHALMPKNATPFPLSDGLFSGFAIRSKTQSIFFLPFSDDRTFLTMKKYVFPYIQRLYGLRLPNFGEYETAFASDILERQLLMSRAQIAVANTPFCKYIAHASKRIDCFADHISYAPYDPKNSDKTPYDLSAVAAADYYECRYGASVVENPKDQYGNFAVTITISDNSKATVRTLSSLPDETHEDFMNTVLNEFFIMLARELALSPPDEDIEPRHIKPSPGVHAFRILIYIALFVTAFFFTYIAVSLSELSLF